MATRLHATALASVVSCVLTAVAAGEGYATVGGLISVSMAAPIVPAFASTL